MRSLVGIFLNILHYVREVRKLFDEVQNTFVWSEQFEHTRKLSGQYAILGENKKHPINLQKY